MVRHWRMWMAWVVSQCTKHRLTIKAVVWALRLAWVAYILTTHYHLL